MTPSQTEQSKPAELEEIVPSVVKAELSSQVKILRWVAIALLFPAICLNGWLVLALLNRFQPFVSLFILAIVLAFVLNYPVQLLQKVGVKRPYSIGLTTVGALALLGLIGVVLLPIVADELARIAQHMPEWLTLGEQRLEQLQSWLISERIAIDVPQTVDRFSNELLKKLDDAAGQLVSVTLFTFGGLSQVLITLVLAFYLLLDGERLTQSVVKRLPTRYGPIIRKSLQVNFQNYFISQGVVALLTSSLMTITFTSLHLNFAVLLGLSTGVMALVPLGDFLVYALVTVIAFSQSPWLGLQVLVLIVVLDQIVDQVVAPRLVGEFVGLRPIWVIVALIVGAKAAGALGLLIAIPMASFIKDVLDGFSDYQPKPSDATH